MNKNLLKKLHISEIKILDEIDRICKKNNITYFLIGGTLLGAVRHKGFIPWDDDLDVAMPRGDYEKFLTLCPKELNNDFILDDITTNDEYWLIFAKIRLKYTILESGYNKKYNYPGNKGIWVDIFPFDETNHFNDKYIKYKGKKIKLLKALYMRHTKYSNFPKHFTLNLILLLIKKMKNSQLNFIIKKQITSENKDNCIYFINYGSQYGIERQIHLKDRIFPLSKIEFEGKLYPAPKDSDYVLKNIYGNNYMTIPPLESQITHNPHKIKFEDGEEIIFDDYSKNIK